MRLAIWMAVVVMTADAKVPPAVYRLTICADGVNELEYLQAIGRATQLFAQIGIRLDWRSASHCPEGALRISVSMTGLGSHPGALGYALPYEGTHIVLLWDRIQDAVPHNEHVNLIAHVMAHEITHVLEGVSRHSRTGMMKAHWGSEDYHAMAVGLPWTDDDLLLIRQGLEQRLR